MKVDEVLQAEALWRVFNGSDWLAVLKIEEDMHTSIEKQILRQRCDNSLEEYAKNHIRLNAMREVLGQLWLRRSNLLNMLKEKDDGKSSKEERQV